MSLLSIAAGAASAGTTLPAATASTTSTTATTGTTLTTGTSTASTTSTTAAAALWESVQIRVLEAGGFDVVANSGVAFVAGVLVHVVAGIELPRELYRPRAHQHRGIFDRHFVFDCFGTGASEPLHDTHVLRLRVQWRRAGNTGVRHCGFAVEIQCLYNQRVAIPSSSGLAQVLLDR